MTLPRLVPAPKIDNRSDDELLRLAREFYEMMRRRRTFRNFSDRPVPRKVGEHCIRAAGTAPSGANLQPWHFVAVGGPQKKKEICVAAEAEGKKVFEKHAPQGRPQAQGAPGPGWGKPLPGNSPRPNAAVPPPL